MNKDIGKTNIPLVIKRQLQMQAYLDRAIGYYIFSRKAVKLQIVPVGGNLFHNAIEMFLHCGLSSIYTQKELEKKFGKHELYEMWTEFKLVFNDKELGSLDTFINEQKQWKYLRYPKNTDGSAIYTGVKKMDPLIMKENMSFNNKQGVKIQIELNLQEMDKFVNLVVHAIKINPNYIKLYLQRNSEIMNFYLEYNEHPLFDLSLSVNSSNMLE